MSNFNGLWGHRYRWVNNAAGGMRQEDVQSERPASQDSLIAESAKRAFIKSAREKRGELRACELLAMLPDCPKTTKSIDEIVYEGMSIIELI